MRAGGVVMVIQMQMVVEGGVVILLPWSQRFSFAAKG